MTSTSGQNWSWTSEQRIPSDTTAGRRLLDLLLAQLSLHDWDEQDTFGVHLATEEALVNAIKHGNREDPQKTVHVISKVSPREVWIQITDEGEGFDPSQVPDPTDEDNLESPSGRGLMLMRSFMSEVKFNGLGNRVLMVKRRSP